MQGGPHRLRLGLVRQRGDLGGQPQSGLERRVVAGQTKAPDLVVIERSTSDLRGLRRLRLAAAHGGRRAPLHGLRKHPLEQLARFRALADREVRHALEVLPELGAMRGATQSFSSRSPLAGVADPPVWRRLLVPAATRLDRLHQVLQAAMGWEDSHLHAFTDGRVRYGRPDQGLHPRDERTATGHSHSRAPLADHRWFDTRPRCLDC